jgi:recombination protein RecT
MSNTDTALVRLIDAEEARFNAVSCHAPGIQFASEKGFALQILGANDYLARIAVNNPDSLRNAVVNTAAIGISLNPASKQAYLVPRKGAVCLDISYMGMMHIAQQCGAIQWGQAVVVRKLDTFELQPIGQAPIHKYDPFATDRGDIIGCYVVVKTDTGDFLTTAIPIAKIYDVRDRSEAWKTYVKDKSKKCPWVTDEEEMIKKTVVKNASKYWPRRERLDQAVHYMNTDGGEGLALVPGRGAEPKDVTPASADQQIAITDRLRELKKSFSDLAPFFATKYKQSFEAVGDLTEEQATAVLSFIQRKAA